MSNKYEVGTIVLGIETEAVFSRGIIVAKYMDRDDVLVVEVTQEKAGENPKLGNLLRRSEWILNDFYAVEDSFHEGKTYRYSYDESTDFVIVKVLTVDKPMAEDYRTSALALATDRDGEQYYVVLTSSDRRSMKYVSA